MPERMYRSTSRSRCASNSRSGLVVKAPAGPGEAEPREQRDQLSSTCQDRSAVRRRRAMTPAMRSQFSVSFASWRRPAFVIA